MNAKEFQDWFEASWAARPRLGWRKLEKQLGRLLAGRPGAWAAGVESAPGGERFRFRFFGKGNPGKFFREAAEELLVSAPPRAAPPEGFPWVEAAWDFSAGEWSQVCLLGPGSGAGRRAEGSLPFGKVLFTAAEFTEACLKEPAWRAILPDGISLFPVREVVTQWDAGAGTPTPTGHWGLRLREPLPWPFFQRLALAGPFEKESCRFMVRVGGRRVSELWFEGGNACAFVIS